MTYAKLPQRTKDVLALPASELRRLVAERRKLLEAKSAKEKAAKENKAAVKAAKKTADVKKEATGV